MRYNASTLGSVGGYPLQSSDRCGRGRKIRVDRRLHDGVGRIEIAVGELVPHAGDVDPGDVRLSVKELRSEPLHRFAYLDQPESDGIEHETVVERPPLQMVGDRRKGVSNVGEPFVIISTHKGMDSASARALTRGRTLSDGITST